MARKNLPSHFLEEIQPGLSIEWWGRRATYEYIEELSDALFWCWALASLVYGLVLLLESPSAWWGLLLLVFPARHFVMELLKWYDEVYVVCRNDDRGDGEVYKFHGTFTQKKKSDPITNRSPASTTVKPFRYRVWGWLTGEHMERVTLSSDNNIYLKGERVSPQFDKSIRRVRSADTKKDREKMPDAVSYLREIDRLAIAGYIPQAQAKHYVQTILGRVMFGEP